MHKLIDLTREELEKEHLSVIRELGRHIGVKAPASKKKKEIIKDILEIQNGTKEPESVEKRGAPSKEVDISKYYKYPDDKPYFEVPKNNIIFNASEFYEEQAVKTEPFEMEGVLDMHSMGFGFLRVNIYENTTDDAYVSCANIKRYKLRKGDKVRCIVEPKVGSAPPLSKVITINGEDPSAFNNRTDFDELVPCYPNERIKLETNGKDVSLRCIDLFAPIGKGQRGLVVAPPKTGKTTLLKQMAKSIEVNHPNIKLMVLLIDERPEEVTDFRRELVNAELTYSTFDESAEHHVRSAEYVFNRAKGYVEAGRDVVVLLDSITRLARAYNSTVEPSGRTLSGGLDPFALHGPKRLFGSARNVENGGSLTVIATALVDTGSRMDDVVYEEFKGTGNMEIHLSRDLSERRIFPAIDLYKSGTRKDELLLSEEEINSAYKLRRTINEKAQSVEALVEMIKRTKSNSDLVAKTDAWLSIYNK